MNNETIRYLASFLKDRQDDYTDYNKYDDSEYINEEKLVKLIEEFFNALL